MNQDVVKQFKAWMLNSGKTVNTANSYVSALNMVSKHYGQDVFLVNNLDVLHQIYGHYGPGGQFSEIGDATQNRPNIHAGLKQWLSYQQALQADGPVVADEAVGAAPRQPENQPLNQILFGPPGTGKTFATIDTALEILDPAFLAEHRKDRRALKNRFDAFAKVGQVRLVTFHQSFSYEDFVEGLRAETGDEGQLAYNVEPGVFKRICDDARTHGTQPDAGVRSNPRIWKISINGTGASATKSYCLEHGEARIGWGETGDLRDKPALTEYYERLGAGDKGTLQYFSEGISVGDVLLCIHSADEIGAVGVVTGDYRYEQQVPAGVIGDYQHVRPVNWVYRDVYQPIQPLNDNRQFTLKTVYHLARFSWADLVSYLDKQGVKPVRPVAPEAAERKPHVLIIDEINRGNVSRIFGELITLIEPSKRAGADEALSVELPYSKKPFSVPDNVYLIGTMNTADRSLAGLDIALRRRFVFREMPPQPDLLEGCTVAGVDIGRLLEVMNQRIELLLDRDHCLGHAYFMPLVNDPRLERLADIFRNQVLPLLQEYFFEDWQRIQWVLNDHRKAASDCFVYQRKLDTAALLGPAVDLPAHSLPWCVNEEAFERPEAYRGITDAESVLQESAEEQVEYDGCTVKRLVSGSIQVWRAGKCEPVTKPALRELAAKLCVELVNAQGAPLTTRQLGARVIAAIGEQG
ncbi:AAA family ATPase [Stutzerimonas urumqiensis]|uniref:AAA family ATPase n=1 Tax=Stutzerimonas urumqiensis TaxID=638269 RepID=UPI001FEAE1CB|nr:AAA family ATPase [Stutzerimonas urumqiensis]